MKYLKYTLSAVCLIAASPTLAKKASEATGLELQQIQSRDVEASKDVAFSAVMSVLQDAGYRIGSADKETGLITGTASTTAKLSYNIFWGFGKNKKTPIVSAYIEPRGSNGARIRVTGAGVHLEDGAAGLDGHDAEADQRRDGRRGFLAGDHASHPIEKRGHPSLSPARSPRRPRRRDRRPSPSATRRRSFPSRRSGRSPGSFPCTCARTWTSRPTLRSR